MPGVLFDIQAFGFVEAEGKMQKMTYRVTDMRPGFEEIETMLEEGEERLFESYHGKYVDTGALKASLTQPRANKAIREAHAQHLDFGTAVYYARFHKDKKGKSAVLVLQSKERKKIPVTLLEYVMHGGPK